MAFRWRADGGPLLGVYWVALLFGLPDQAAYPHSLICASVVHCQDISILQSLLKVYLLNYQPYAVKCNSIIYLGQYIFGLL